MVGDQLAVFIEGGRVNLGIISLDRRQLRMPRRQKDRICQPVRPGVQSRQIRWDPSPYQKQGAVYQASERWTPAASFENYSIFGFGCTRPSGTVTSRLSPTSLDSGRIVETIEFPCDVLLGGTKKFQISIRYDYYLQ